MSIFLKHGRLITCLRASALSLPSVLSRCLSMTDLSLFSVTLPKEVIFANSPWDCSFTPTASQSLAINWPRLLSSKRSCNNRNYFLCLHCVFPHHRADPWDRDLIPPCSPLYPYCLGWCLAHSRCPILTRYSIKLFINRMCRGVHTVHFLICHLI